MQAEWLALIPNCVSTATGPENLPPLSIEIDKPLLLNSAAEPGGIHAAVKGSALGAREREQWNRHELFVSLRLGNFLTRIKVVSLQSQ